MIKWLSGRALVVIADGHPLSRAKGVGAGRTQVARGVGCGGGRCARQGADDVAEDAVEQGSLLNVQVLLQRSYFPLTFGNLSTRFGLLPTLLPTSINHIYARKVFFCNHKVSPIF